MAINDSQLDNETLDMLRNPSIHVTLPLIYMLVIVIGVPGNLFSLWLLCLHTKPKSPSVIFLINLSLTDLILVFFLPFQIIYNWKRNHWDFSVPLCSVVTVLFYSNMYCSILTMMCISIDRCIGVVYPLHRDWRKKRYAVATCLGMWAVVLTALCPFMLTDLTYKVEALNITTCFDVLKRNMLPNTEAWAAFLFTLFVFLFLIPFIITIVCYTLVILKLVQSSSKNGREPTKRSIYLAAVVLFVFVTCFAPNNFTLLVHMVSRLFFDKGVYPAYKLTLSFSCLNSCLNPFIYYFASKEFYKKLLQICGYKTIETEYTECRRESMFSARSMSQTCDSHELHSPVLTRQESVF
ncbi:P2Y purinoceptor 8 [Latimeria chalumnae]|nr:PREDICTED: P2Y purinoceptor 8 [Latimeria chalumnae]|eukprot:XP_005997258.1 PREDICTED: P2Y purinoceptor 8 [Latimeria chalumnae]